MKIFFVGFVLSLITLTFAESLFQVKATNGRTVLDVTSNGLVVLNPNYTQIGFDDTLMIITDNQMKSFISGTSGKGLARSMSVVSTGSSKETQRNVLELTETNALMSVGTNAFELTPSNAVLSTGTGGNQYTNFSPSNTFIGFLAGKTNNNGSSNVFIGDSAGYKNTSGPRNVFIGPSAGFSNTTQYNSVFIGYLAGYKNQANQNVFMGFKAGRDNTSGQYNTFIGNQSGQENITGGSNTFLGNYAGSDNTSGLQNTYVGSQTGRNNIDGIDNTYIGFCSGTQGTTGDSNVFVGKYSGADEKGSRNIFLGMNAGYKASQYPTRFGNVFLGFFAGSPETGSNRLYIANSNTTTPLIYGQFDNKRVVINGNNPNGFTFYVNGSAGGTSNWNVPSDKNLKKDIETIPDALKKVEQLRGVYFKWKDPKNEETGVQMGFIAQESEKIIPEVVHKNGDSYTMQYAPITAVLVEAVKELNQQNILLKKELEEIKKLIKK